jgi:hypothetical protein
VKIGIMQPYLFPYIGYFQLMNMVDKYVIYDDVQFIKGGWINRNNILIQGEKRLFSIQLDDASPNKMINEIDIKDNFENFQKTITMAYSKAPYFEQVFEAIKKICSYNDKNLARFIGNSFVEIAKYLDFQTEFIYSSTLQKDNTLRGQDKVIAICKELGGDQYFNAIGGQELYSRQDFANHGMELKFLKPHLAEYKQFSNEFIPGLSFIDIMMFNSPEEVKKMLDDYELI